MQLRHMFSELGQGLRRNLSMHLAVILTLFVSLSLVGVGVLLSKEATKAAEYWGSQLQITIYLCKDGDDNPACSSEVTPAQKEHLLEVVDQNPEVASYRIESKEQAFAKVKELLGPEKFDGPNPPATADAMKESVWVELKDPTEYAGITSAVKGLDGVSAVGDMREVLKPILGSIAVLQYSAWFTAGILVLAALLLVANTIRLAAMARRREIGIMRLVGASTLYISLPFLMEAIVTALIGFVLSASALAAFMKFGIQQRAEDRLKFIPWIGWAEYTTALIWIGTLALVLTVVPTLVLTRKYLKV
jgi:cell division transport system permease protein